MGNTNSAIKGLVSDFAGTSDTCEVVADVSRTWASSYLLPEEEILFALQSIRHEFSFTGRALIKLSAKTSTTTRKRVERLEYKKYQVKHVMFESTGVVDRDCKLQFQIGDEEFTLKVLNGKEEKVMRFYKALILLGQQQEEKEQEWELVKQALATAKDTVRLLNAGSHSLNQQSDETLKWIKIQYEFTHPHCYKALIKRALAARRKPKKAGPLLPWKW
ncbi:unnamed protein product [Peronospora farinosa]|uniref:Bacterial Pleckstrin homology domain-containing protein n=1 Tax=Peronospora farinosa TaxID=134698 RepID=A0AAV0SU96_9STRA|nr:unnamed protein product [Peronospora farinosa]CAI5705465.1 unnamed protein product [Peronospora farinosa]